MNTQEIVTVAYAILVIALTLMLAWYLAGSPGSQEQLGWFERRPRMRTHGLIEKLSREGEKIINMHMIRLINEHRPPRHDWNG